MRLIKLYIKNFGTISDMPYEFETGLNTILQENGWGKTTFAAFIKAMFYGMENSTKRSLDENEKKRYRPWNKGAYGGSLVFETDGGRVYCVERYFGEKDSADSFALYDEATNQISNDYTENLGEELFRIDRASFERSILIPQLLQKSPAGATDSINARLTNLMDSGNDIDSYDLAMAKLDEGMKYYRKTGGRGALDAWEQELLQVQGEILRLGSLEESYQKREEELFALHGRRNSLIQERADCDSKLELAGKYEASRRIAGEYQTLCQDVQTAQEWVDRIFLRTFQAKGVPAKEAVEQTAQAMRDEMRIRTQAGENQVSMEEENWYQKVETMLNQNFWGQEAIGGETPVDVAPENDTQAKTDRVRRAIARSRKTLAETDVLREELGKLEKKREYLREIQSKFANLNPEEDLKKAMEFDKSLNETNQRIALKQGKLDDLMAQSQKEINVSERKGLIYGCYGAAVVFFLAGIVLGILTEPILFLLCAVGILLAVYGVVVSKGVEGQKQILRKEQDSIRERAEKLRESIEDDENSKNGTLGFVKLMLCRYGVNEAQDIGVLEQEIRNRYQDYVNGKQAMQENEERYGDTVTKLRNSQQMMEQDMAALRVITGQHDEAEEAFVLDEAEKVCNTYQELAGRRLRFREYSRQIRAVSEPSIQFFDSYFPGKERNEASLSEIREEMSLIAHWQEQLRERTGKKTAFEKEYDLEALRELLAVPPEDMEVLRARREDILARQSETDRRISTMEQECQRMEEQLELLGEREQLQEQLQEQIALGEETFRRLKKTKDLLEKAKSTFSTRYLMDLNTSFDKYMEQIDEKTVSHEATVTSGRYGYRLDEKLDITVDAEGSRRDLKAMSLGYRDLTAFCMRLALVEAMFKDEKPFLIMDDPFVNLDEQKISRAKELIHALEEKYQILYFTCHDSRAI